MQQHLAEAGLFDQGLKMRSMVLPDIYIDHDKPERMYAQAGLDAAGIVNKVMDVLGQDAVASKTRPLSA